MPPKAGRIPPIFKMKPKVKMKGFSLAKIGKMFGFKSNKE